MALRIRWTTRIPPDEVSFTENARIMGAEILDPQDQQVADIEVVDEGYFDHTAGFHDYLVRGGVPRLIITRSPDAEFTAISGMMTSPGDQFCRVDRLETELVPRICRLLTREPHAQPSLIDALTGLPNLAAVTEELERLSIGAAPERPLSVLLIDIDHFKHINDTYGHTCGDRVLRRIGKIVAHTSQGLECAGRLGGEELAVVATLQFEQAVALADFIRSEIETARFTTDVAGEEREFGVTVSVGVHTEHQPTAGQDLIGEANRAVFAAKELGRNRVISTIGDLDPQLGESGAEASLSDYETRVRVLAERFAEQIISLGSRVAGQFKEEAERDGLTGLFNRRYFDRRLAREVEKTIGASRRISLIMLDVDHFGHVNRQYGFPGGDRALQLVGEVLRTNIRTVDWVARYGGEEFCVVMPETSLDEALPVAERLRVALKAGRTHAVDGREIRLTGSFAVVELNAEGEPTHADPVQLIQAASDKIREAKQSGRDRVCS